MKKILIHSPYWHIAGGGERYALTAAVCLQTAADVFVDAASQDILRRLLKNLGLPGERIRIFDGAVTPKTMTQFDGAFWVSDGSIPFLPVKRKVIHFQAPFQQVNGGSVKNRVKLFGTHVICNSRFTKNFIDQEFGVNSSVIYPPVEVGKFTPMKKDNLILTVGRFVTTSQYKRPDILVQTFKKMIDDGLKGWRFCVIGMLEDQESETMVTALRTMSRGYPIAIKTNLPHERLISLFDHAAIYWHAAGYGANLVAHPERAEHFGISTVEAMAAGAVPCVFAGGGQLEIVSHNWNGLLWKTPEELMSQTAELISSTQKREVLADRAIQRAGDFSEKRFCQEIQKLFSG